MARIRAYFKLDLYFFEHPKVVDLSNTAIVLYIASIAYANRRETDGYIAYAVLRRLVEVDEQEDRSVYDVAKELVRAGLWKEARPGFVQTDTEPRPPDGPGGWQIHDFLDHNDSNEERASRRDADAARKRRVRGGDASGRDEPAGQPPNPSSPVHVQADRFGHPNGQERPSEPVRGIAVAVTEQSTNRTEDKINTVVEQARPIDDTTAVFQTWQEATGKHRARLDDKRRRRIREALKHYPLADVLDAVQGWQHSPFHCGQNDTATKHNDLELLLRDAKHLEEFRDLWRDGPPRPVSKQTAQAMRTSVAMRARAQARAQAEEVNGDRGRVGRSGGSAERGLPAPAD